MSKTLDFYFDFYSPFGYLASLQIDELAAKHGREAIWRPTLLGPAFKAMGQTTMLEIPMLGDYAMHDFDRYARMQNVPVKVPKKMPNHALPAARAFYYINEDEPALAKKLAKKVFHEIFNQGRDGSKPELLADVAEELGIDSAALLTAIAQTDVKQRLFDEVDKAMARGVFGSPMIFVDDEPFWGNDRLEQVDLWLQRGGW